MNWLFYYIGLWIEYFDGVIATDLVIVANDAGAAGALPNRTYLMNPVTLNTAFTLPAASLNLAARFTIKNNQVSSGFDVTFVAANGTDTLEQQAVGLTTLENLDQFTVESDGVSNWVVVG